MKRLVLTVAFVTFLSLSAFADWDFNSPTYGTFATQAELDSISGISGSTPTAIALDTDGSLIVVNDPGGSAGNLIDVTAGTPPTGSIIIAETGTGSLDEAQLTPSGDLDVDAMVVASDGAIYLAEHDTGEDLIKVVRTPSVAASNFKFIDGQNDLVINAANTLFYVSLEGGFKSPAGDDEIVSVALSDGTQTTVATQAQLLAGTGGTGVGIGPLAIFANDDLAGFDEAAFGGTDSIFKVENPGPSPTVTALYATSVFPAAPGFSNLVATPVGDLIGWEEFSGAGEQLTIIPAGTTDSSGVISIPSDTLEAGWGIPTTTNVEADDTGRIVLEVVSGATDDLVVYIADAFGSGGIYTITFPGPPSRVGSWHLFN